MIDWKTVDTAPRDGRLVLIGTESDPAVDRHMFFVDLGTSNTSGFHLVTKGQEKVYPSHWAPVSSPVEGATPVFYSRSNYVFG